VFGGSLSEPRAEICKIMDLALKRARGDRTQRFRRRADSGRRGSLPGIRHSSRNTLASGVVRRSPRSWVMRGRRGLFAGHTDFVFMWRHQLHVRHRSE